MNSLYDKNVECDERKDTLNFRNACSGDTKIVNNSKYIQILILLLLHLYCRIFSEIERNFPVICLPKKIKKSIKSGAHQIYKNWLTLYYSIYSEKTNKIMKKKMSVFFVTYGGCNIIKQEAFEATSLTKYLRVFRYIFFLKYLLVIYFLNQGGFTL